MSFIKYEYININKFSRPGIKNYGIKGLIMHYTANNGGTARNHKTYFNNLNGIYASAHLFVDDNEAICIIPLNEVAYHANDTVKYNADGTIYKPLYSKIGNANYGAIGLEMCLDKNGKITEKTFQNAVKAVKELVAKYPAITRNTIWRHYDVTGKNCPAPWVSKPSELERFKDAVFANTPNKVVQQIITQGSSNKISGLGYRLHVQSKSPYECGTLGYVKEGETAGTTGKGLRAEWLEVVSTVKPMVGALGSKMVRLPELLVSRNAWKLFKLN